MTITSHQIHNVLRTYGKQLRRGARLNRVKQVDVGQIADKINISPEAKRRQVVERVASEIIFRLANQDLQGGGVEKEILATLSREYGRPLNVTYDQSSGGLSFNVVDTDRGEIVRTLDGEEADGLRQRLAEVTHQVVDRNML
ncbi:MAG: DVU0524 family FlgM-associated protein [Thermodesulfobacteriota bacterium]|nr:DVU0524 family FlgM-associated protein [Thermodesulfobacteriota bacterium]